MFFLLLLLSLYFDDLQTTLIPNSYVCILFLSVRGKFFKKNGADYLKLVVHIKSKREFPLSCKKEICVSP